MSEHTLSKAAKKNKKRNAKKKTKTSNSGTLLTHEDAPTKKINDKHDPEMILKLLQEQLSAVKEDKDHAKALKIREQIWVLKDLVEGIRTDIPDEELRPILDNIPFFQNKDSLCEPAPPATVSVLAEPDKKLRSLRKKLDQIERLKKKQSEGEKLESNQIKKVESEQDIKDEIKDLEEAMAQCMTLKK